MDEEREVERHLDAMFASARPRRGFEDELWSRIEARRPWHARLRGWLAVPAHLAPALAAALVVVIGGGWLLTGFHPGGGQVATSSAGTGSAFAPAQARPAFGVLPPAAGVRPDSQKSASNPAPQGADALAVPAFSGALPSLPPALPVFRYDEPTVADLDHGASNLTTRSGLQFVARPSDAAAGRPAGFSVDGISVPAASGQAFVGEHNLLPTYSFQLVTGAGAVVYQRLFTGPAGQAPEVDAGGAPAGLTVDFDGGNVTRVSAPLELPLTAADYPVRSAAAALAGSGIGPGPAARPPLAGERAELVYVLAVEGGHGYFEPALLVSQGSENVLLPLVAAPWQGR